MATNTTQKQAANNSSGSGPEEATRKAKPSVSGWLSSTTLWEKTII